MTNIDFADMVIQIIKDEGHKLEQYTGKKIDRFYAQSAIWGGTSIAGAKLDSPRFSIHIYGVAVSGEGDTPEEAIRDLKKNIQNKLNPSTNTVELVVETTR